MATEDAQQGGAGALVERQQAINFLQPPSVIYSSAVDLAKKYLDSLAAEVSTIQESKLRAAAAAAAATARPAGQTLGKRRRNGQAAVGATGHQSGEVLRIKRVHTDGFAIEQIWEQARRVLDAAVGECDNDFEQQFGLAYEEDDEDEGSDEEDEQEGSSEGAEFGSELGDELSVEESGEEDEESDDAGFAEMEGLEGMEVDDDDSSPELGEENEDDASESGESIVEDVHGLNDGFFSIDEFNKQTQLMENDNGEEDSDEDIINWTADPFSEFAVANSLGEPKGAKARKARRDEDEDESEEDGDDDDDDGPTFGNMDLYAPEGASDDGDDDDVDVDDDNAAGASNANNVMYADFFEAPKKKTRKNKKGRPHPHNFPAKTDEPEDEAEQEAEQERELEHAMASVKADLFDALSEDEEDENQKSSHERKQAALLQEIRELEAEQVARRHWTLQGEASAKSRPMNSLLEEDLDFERAGKPLPVVTPEVSEDIEALIKRRILNREFDEVIRRRPDEVLAQTMRRGKLDGVDDRKSAKGLAELYEEDHLRKNDANFVDERDEALKAQHAELESMWKTICGNLDSLSNWHYRPKPAAPSLEIRVDAAAITMEDARPAGAEGLTEPGAGSSSMLAPQEIYKPGQDAAKGQGKTETTTRAGLPVATAEMSREEKKRRRRREKERIRKANGNKVAAKEDGSRKGQQRQVVENLKRANVRIIGKKGELRDVDGEAVSEGPKQGRGGMQLKL